MYLILVIFIIVVGYYYWESLKSMFEIFNVMTTPVFNTINPWFMSLLFINIICFIFLRWLYNQRINTVGNKGSMGNQGFPGYTGSNCILPCK